MHLPTVLQTGLPEIVTDLLGIAATVVLLLIVVALGAFAYKSLTGGVDWPEQDLEENDDTLREGDQDDEWDYY